MTPISAVFLCLWILLLFLLFSFPVAKEEKDWNFLALFGTICVNI